MRHLIGIGLAIGLAAAVFFAAGWGYLRLLRVPVVNGGASTLPANGGSLLHSANVGEAAAALAGTALVAAIFIAVRRISPLAAGLPGLALLAWTGVYAFSVRRAVHYIPLRGDAFGAGFEAMLFNGLLAAAGLALVVPLFIPSRWRAQARRQGTGTPDSEGVVPAQEPAASLSGNVSTVSTVGNDWAETASYPADESFRGNDSYPD
ncbi:MAG TPA: hypothetical protein VMI73_08785 [Trebonia sp.]|nr:hypothetical protein [Trebonia sp.]